MARKSPRSRKKATPRSRLGGSKASPSSPRKRVGKKGAPASQRAHAPKGARATAARKTAASRKKKTVRKHRFKTPEHARVTSVLKILHGLYPDANVALDFKNPLQLLIATILSAQCTDVRVNMVTPALFARYPNARAFAAAEQEDVEELVRSTGFYRNKARSIRECCADIVELHGGEVPRTMDALKALRGVGRKTANVVLGNAFGIPGIVVDTHVTRLSNRLAFTNESDAVKIEFALMPVIPEANWSIFSHWLILHGRSTCIARKPRCSICTLAPHCPRVGVKVSQ